MPLCHCGKTAHYNIAGNKAIFCGKHREPNMINVIHKKCEVIGCHITPVYNFPGNTTCRFCKMHKLNNMIDVKNKSCESDKCTKQPMYNIHGTKNGRFCAEHKHASMIDVINNICQFNECGTLAVYNIPGTKKGKFCINHKELHMIDIKNKTCEINGCRLRPNFNFFGETKGRLCKEHKEIHMIDVTHKTCEINDCNTRPNFNSYGEKRGRFCAKHKHINMINVEQYICKMNECNKRANYNFSDQKKGLFCLEHKHANMINLSRNICEHNGCNTQTTYGWLGKKSTHCASHKQKGMILNSTKKCSTCKQLGTYEANSIRYCENHKPNDSTNLGLQKCSLCGLDNILIDETCNDCNPVIVELYQHAKENHIRDILHANGLNTFIHDKMLEGPACGRERPDFQFDCGTHFVYLEVDENQHRSYPCECEQTRMINLVEVRGMPVRFIRYNPDSYQPVNGQFMLTTHLREKKLIEYVNYAIKHSPQEENNIADVLYLCYDEYDIINHIWNKLI